jgi:transglutaminase-like putative cysteine protease
MKISLSNKMQEVILKCLDCLMIILGIVGVMGGFIHSLFFPTQSLFALVFLALLGIFLYLNYTRKQLILKSLLLVLIIAIIILFLLFPIQMEGLFHQLEVIVRNDYFLDFQYVFESINEAVGLLPIILVIIVGIPIVYLIVSLICQHRHSLLKMILLILLFFSPVFIRHSLESYTSYCFVLFALYQFVFSWLLQYQHNQLLLRSVLIISLSLLLVFSSIFLEPNPLFNQNTSSILMEVKNWINGGSLDSLFNSQNVTGTSSYIDGKLPTNDVETSRGIAMKVHAKEPFDSYLRGYSLAHYIDNQWQLGDDSYELSTSTTQYSRYLKANHTYEVQSVEIETTKQTEYQFVPYFPNFEREIMNDSYYQKFDQPMDILMAYPQEYTFAQYSANLDVNYQEYVYQQYLDVPSSLKERLNEFLSQHQIYNDNIQSHGNLINRLKKVLFQTTKYDLKAGALPKDKDFLEYFLFENQKGSCTHFATAGALLLRCLGIPTRYVRGYILKASDFTDGTAIIRNYRSHAWIEVYENEKGWVPFEMTPGVGESTLEEVGAMLDDLAETNTQQTNPNAPAQTQTPSTTPQTSQTKPVVDENPWYQGLIEYQETIMLIAAVLVGMITYRVMTKHLFTLKMRKYDNNQKLIYYYQRMLRILRFGGEIDEEVVALANKAQFSQHSISVEELTRMQEFYNIFIQDVYQNISIFQKFVFRCIYGYK